MFIKTLPMEASELSFFIEVRKSLIAHHLFRRMPDIVVPQLISYSYAERKLSFSRLNRLHSLDHRSPSRFFRLAGVALATIHSDMTLPKELSIPRLIDQNAQCVPIHGDFSRANVGIVDNSLCVYDWGLRPWETELFTMGSPSIDLCSFVISFLVPPLFNKTNRNKIYEFIFGYFDALFSKKYISLSKEKLIYDFWVNLAHILNENKKRSYLPRLLFLNRLAFTLGDLYGFYKGITKGFELQDLSYRTRKGK